MTGWRVTMMAWVILGWTALGTGVALAGEETTACSDDGEILSVQVPGQDGNSSVRKVRLGGSLYLCLRGALADKLAAAVKNGALPALTLYLDGTKMTNLPYTPYYDGDGGVPTRVKFDLLRNSEDAANRKAWDTFLRQKRGYEMSVPVGLAVGSEPVIEAAGAGTVTIYVATKQRIMTTVLLCVAVFVVAYIGLVRHRSILRDSPEGYYSLGKSQMAFWGLLIVMSFFGLWSITESMEYIPDQALLLMGISSATALGSIYVGQQRVSMGTAAAPTKVEQAKFWEDICSDGDGITFHRLQIVLWTMVLGMVFVVTVAKVMSMPEFSDTLLILMGISSGTYLGFKFPEK